jgi:GH15 family glucan-1,4-alpha-glucosidase
MGDRANFGFKDRKGDTVFLYGHWAGHMMLQNLASAVHAAESRWDDESYATRIAISNLINEEWQSTTGWGITVNELADNEHRVPIIDWNKKTFTLMEEDLTTEVFSTSLSSFVEKYSLVSVE